MVATVRVRVAHRGSPGRAAVDQELHLVGVGVHLDGDGLPFGAGPRPRRDRVGERPHLSQVRLLAVVRGRAHREVRRVAQAPHDLPPVRHRQPEPGDVDVAAVRGDPRVLPHEPASALGDIVTGVAHPTDAGLAEVVPAGPGEVADHVRLLAHQLPVAGDLRRVRLAADDHAAAGTGRGPWRSGTPRSCIRPRRGTRTTRRSSRPPPAAGGGPGATAPSSSSSC